MVKRLNMDNSFTAEEVWRLQHAAFAAEWRELGGGFTPMMDTVAVLRQCGETFFGIAEGGELEAAISCLRQDDAVIVRRLMVRPDCFRRGLATRLLRHVERQYRKCASIEAFAAANNNPAVRLYTSAGYRDCGDVMGPYGIAMIRFRKSLRQRGEMYRAKSVDH